jgi:hypothetical protein
VEKSLLQSTILAALILSAIAAPPDRKKISDRSVLTPVLGNYSDAFPEREHDSDTRHCANGVINATDVSIIKSHIGIGLSP